MNNDPTEFRQPMHLWPALSKYAKSNQLPETGVEIFYYDTEAIDLPAALLIHGLGDEADTWRHLIAPLSSRWRVIAPDLPGFGRSSKPKSGYSISFFQQVLFEFLMQLSIQRLFLIGHSLGAAIAHQMTLEKPKMVSGLVLLDGSIDLQPQSLNLGILLFLIPACGEWLYNRLRSDPKAAYRSLEPYYVNLAAMPKEDRDFLNFRVNQRVWSDDQRRAYFSTLRSLAGESVNRQRNIKEALADLNVPTLVLWGEEDQIYSPQSARMIARFQPEVRMVLIPEAGHNVHQENPQRVAAEILSDVRFTV